MPINHCTLINKIIREWIEFAENMGSTYKEIRYHTIILNGTAGISCDFANCLIHRGKVNWSLARELGGLFSVNSFSAYYIGQSLDSGIIVKPAKYGSVMYISNEKWTKYRNNGLIKDYTNGADIRVIRLQESDLLEFVDTVFDAFGYEEQFKDDSLALYNNGIKSGNVVFYGLFKSDTLVSCAMLHKSPKLKIGGLELVSTKRKYQSQGFSKILISWILDKNFQEGLGDIWLFSIKNSIAEKFYSKLGFEIISNIYVFRFSKSPESI